MLSDLSFLVRWDSLLVLSIALLLFSVRMIGILRTRGTITRGELAVSTSGAVIGVGSLLLILQVAHESKDPWIGLISLGITAWITYSVENRSNKDIVFGLLAVLLAFRERFTGSEYTERFFSIHATAILWAALAGGYSYLLLIAADIPPTAAKVLTIGFIVLGAFPGIFAALLKTPALRNMVVILGLAIAVWLSRLTLLQLGIGLGNQATQALYKQDIPDMTPQMWDHLIANGYLLGMVVVVAMVVIVALRSK